MIKTISYLGLGTMGSGMASNLLKAGYKLTVWNRNAEKCKPFVGLPLVDLISEGNIGLTAEKPKTLEDVGRDFGVTLERIRQLQNIALAKLRRALSKKEDLPDVAEGVAA